MHCPVLKSEASDMRLICIVVNLDNAPNFGGRNESKLMQSMMKITPLPRVVLFSVSKSKPENIRQFKSIDG